MCGSRRGVGIMRTSKLRIDLTQKGRSGLYGLIQFLDRRVL
jgi:hypothetical protein